jgi:minor extracellular serine protease Vpr
MKMKIRRLFAISLLLMTVMSAAAGNFSARTRIVAARAKKSLLNNKGICALDNTVQAFITIKDDVAIDSLKAAGVKINSRFGTVVTAQVPLRSLNKIVAFKNTGTISVAQNLVINNDKARQLSNFANVSSGTGFDKKYTGKGVILGIVDTGVDFNHINLLDSTGNSRVKSAYLPCIHTGNRPVIDGDTLPGSEYVTPEEIKSLTTDDHSISHGTHTTGTAAGSYKANGYYGIAPEAELVICAMPDDSLSDVNIANSVKFIFAYADKVGKPAVVNMSLGSNDGAHDGTSMLCKVFDQLSGEGRICVLSAGNDGDYPVCIQKTITNETDTLRTMLYDCFAGDASIDGYISMWSADSTAHSLRAVVLDKSTNNVIYTTQLFSTLPKDSIITLSSDSDSEFAKYLKGNILIASAIEDNGRFHTVIVPKVSTIGNYRIGVEYIGKVGLKINGWSNTRTYLMDHNVSGWTSGNSIMSISDIATGQKAISVGAYCSRNTTPGINGGQIFARSKPYDIAYFSSFGPDANGIRRPDIVAPGFAVVSSANRYDTVSSTTSNMLVLRENVNGEQYPYGVIYGTSMSAPVVSGTIALWLQANPKLTADDVRKVFENTAVRDSFVVNGNPERWGYGKLDISAGLKYVISSGVNSITGGESVKIYPNPSTGRFTIKAEGKASLQIVDLSGRLMYTRTIDGDTDIDVSDLLINGVYIAKLKSSKNDYTCKIVIRK